MRWNYFFVGSVLALGAREARCQGVWDSAFVRAPAVETPPVNDADGCAAFPMVHGDSVYAVAGGKFILVRAWGTPSFQNEPMWNSAMLHAGTDTLKGVVVGERCVDDLDITVESRRRYFRFLGSSFRSIYDMDGSIQRTDLTLFVPPSSRSPADTLIEETSFDSTPATRAILPASLVRERKRANKTADSARVAAGDRARGDSINAMRWPASMKKLVMQKHVALGMTPTMVRLSWGDPEDINKSIYPTAIHEQWVYGTGNYVYFINGRVSSIQTRR